MLFRSPTVQSPSTDPNATLKETLAPLVPVPGQIEDQSSRESSLPSAASDSPKPADRPVVESHTGPVGPMTQSRRAPQLGLFALFGGVGVFAILGVGLILLIMLPSILPRIAPRAPTATQVPPTAPLTSTPSATPEPVLGFTLVEPQEVLKIAAGLKSLTDLAPEEYSNADTNRVNVLLKFTVNSKTSVPILWSSGWCAVNDQILQQNLTKINFIFEADGYKVPMERLAKNAYQVTDNSNMKGWKCVEYLTVLRDWKPGTYKLKETISFSAAINDGKVAFDAGNMIREYTVNISE